MSSSGEKREPTRNEATSTKGKSKKRYPVFFVPNKNRSPGGGQPADKSIPKKSIVEGTVPESSVLQEESTPKKTPSARQVRWEMPPYASPEPVDFVKTARQVEVVFILPFSQTAGKTPNCNLVVFANGNANRKSSFYIELTNDKAIMSVMKRNEMDSIVRMTVRFLLHDLPSSLEVREEIRSSIWAVLPPNPTAPVAIRFKDISVKEGSAKAREAEAAFCRNEVMSIFGRVATDWARKYPGNGMSMKPGDKGVWGLQIDERDFEVYEFVSPRSQEQEGV
ncbi:uncharacterized protein LTR77_002967 [Saxophila tyrrhenica]|uniref:Uncharacterized protein n=1 Tax=Saxophila tyrrhenica TaxID=1690608 RepID=A0AAV9PJ74_9PEZI|nr:hypothetical protein LTR77_002967 [Saxophila tyrrhenica]